MSNPKPYIVTSNVSGIETVNTAVSPTSISSTSQSIDNWLTVVDLGCHGCE